MGQGTSIAEESRDRLRRVAYLRVFNAVKRQSPDATIASEMERIFKDNLDVDGFLTRQEFKTGCHELGVEITDHAIDVLLHHFDTNGDGKIDAKEFTSFILPKPAGVASARSSASLKTAKIRLASNPGNIAINGSTGGAIVFYSGMYLTSSSFLDLSDGSDSQLTAQVAAIRSHFVSEPTQQTSPLTLQECADTFRTILDRNDTDDQVPPYSISPDGKSRWSKITPGQRMIVKLFQLWCDQGAADYEPIFIRQYENGDGQKCKISWAQGLAKQYHADYVVDIGGEGSLKLIDGTTTSPIGNQVDQGTYSVADDGSELREGILELLRANGIEPARTAIGMTGHWRGRSNAGAVTATLQSIGVLGAVVVTTDDELAWEHAAAVSAFECVCRWTDARPAKIVTIGSGSSSSQIVVSTGNANIIQVLPVPYGTNVRPPPATAAKGACTDATEASSEYVEKNLGMLESLHDYLSQHPLSC
jgi:hypothetical protein